ncbi:MAG: RNA polymerase sigma factor [Candidatus Binataceae bacterium]|jgi:RNA polymerase sigma-70 factor (ECF subfamily)
MANPGLKLPPPFEAAIEPYERELMRFMIRMTGDREDAMELFQEMCLRAYQAYPRLTDFEQIRAWLYRIAVNLCRNRARDNARRARVITDSSVNHREPVVDDASAGQDLGAIRDLIAALPYKQREALTMRKFGGLGYDQIAHALGCSVEGARANVSQALRKLKAEWDQL